MVNAIILINAERRKIQSLSETLAECDGISEVYSVAGDYDLVAIVRVQRNEDLSRLVTEKMVALEGITRTNTLFAFQTFSRHDLERMFAIGMNA